MMCFSVQKLKKRFNGEEQTANTEDSSPSVEVDEAMSPPASHAFLSTRKSFRCRVRAIQNAQRFLNCNPRLRSSHPSYGSRDSSNKSVAHSGMLLLPLGGRARSASELGSSSLDVASPYHPPHMDQSTNGPSPQPLPSPRLASQPLNAYRLPLPSESANTTSLHPSPPRHVSPRINNTDTYTQNITILPSSSSSSSTVPFIQVHNGNNPALSSTITSSMHASQGQSGNNPVLSSIRTHNLIIPVACAKDSELELQPLPPLQPLPALRCFKYDELASACQSFSPDHCFDHADACFYGTIKVKVNGKAIKHQDVVVVRPKETPQQGLQDWISKLLMVAHELHEQPHVCKLVGFCGEDGCLEHMMVYEKLRKGSLCTMLFEESDAPPLDWPMRIKIAYGAAQGLASLHKKFPDKVLYKDFRASSIQVDGDHSSKISGYRLVDTLSAETKTSQNNPRVNAYRAPETVSQGELTQKSNVWSFGVILLELLSGKQNMDERTTRDERHNLVKWAKPFLIDEGKLFLLMDPKLQGKFPLRGAKMVADLVMLCLHCHPTMRPTMREVLDTMKNVNELRYTTRSSTKEPTNTHKFSSSSTLLPSLDALNVKPISSNDQRSSYHRLPTKFDVIASPPLRPLTIPPRCCSEDIAHDCTITPLAHVEF